MASNPSSVPSALAVAVAQADEAVAHAAALRVALLPDLPPATTATAATTVEEPDEGWTVHRVERRIAAIREELDAAVLALRAAGGTTAWLAVDATLRVASALLELGRQINTGRARLVEYSVPCDCNAAQCAFWLYTDVSRRTEIVALNRLSDPNHLVAGQVLQVYER